MQVCQEFYFRQSLWETVLTNLSKNTSTYLRTLWWDSLCQTLKATLSGSSNAFCLDSGIVWGSSPLKLELVTGHIDSPSKGAQLRRFCLCLSDSRVLIVWKEKMQEPWHSVTAMWCRVPILMSKWVMSGILFREHCVSLRSLSPSEYQDTITCNSEWLIGYPPLPSP